MTTRRQHITQSVARQIAVDLQALPKPSYSSLAGKYHTSRDTVRRIDQRQHRPVRSKQAVRCPGCGGLLRKKTTCRKCADTAAHETRRAARSRRVFTGSTLGPGV